MSAKLTIGMAMFRDFDGVYFTIQNLRLNHPCEDVEFIVVDNAPDSPEGEAVKKFIANWGKHGNAGARYIPMPGNTGTAQPRNRIFAEAQGEFVLVLDCHVLLWRDAVRRLLHYYARYAGERNLLQGPLLLDDLKTLHTHFDPVWRAEMFGVWGFDERGRHTRNKPFDIHGQGLGLFTCRKDAWLGFNEHFLGFGGEEMYIHEKFRQAGHRCLCLPFLRWVHRFARPGGIKYPLMRYHKVRNYVLGFNELKWPLDPIREHFSAMSEEEWEHVTADPINNVNPPPRVSQMPKTGRKQPPEGISLEDIFQWVKKNPRDLNEHADTLAKYAAQCKTVTAFTKRREMNAILASVPTERLTIYQTEADPFLEQVMEAVKQAQRENVEAGPGDFLVYAGEDADSLTADPIDQTDMLVIDTIHHGERLLNELVKHGDKVNRFIALRGTAAFGEKAESTTGPGLLVGMRQWTKDRPEWHVTYRTNRQYGLTIFSKLKDDPDIDSGPGTELHKILDSLGIAMSASCDCRGKMLQMNAWGIEGCEKNFDTIVGWMKAGQDKWGWRDKFKAAKKAVTTGLAFKLNPLDPFPSLIRESIKRAKEAK